MSILMMSISFFTFFILAILLKLIIFDNQEIFKILCGYGLGCSYSALFCRIAGGIFTKGADISCDIVGKLDDNQIENDSRNPSSIADNVGDIVGDLIGSVLDLLASIAETFCAVTLILSFMNDDNDSIFNYILFFFSIFMTGQLVFIIIEYIISKKSQENEIISDNEIEDYLFTIIRWTTLIMIVFVICLFSLLEPSEIMFREIIISKYSIMTTVLFGLCAGYLICYSTYYYTGKSFESIQKLAVITSQSPSLNVIYGIAIGYNSTVVPVLIIAITVLFSNLLCGIFGVAFASFGILINLPVILLYQMFGPMADVTCNI
jgi:Na+/H+-translocating membrane pyrophosphatase